MSYHKKKVLVCC